MSENHSTDNTPAILADLGSAIRVISPPHHLGMIENYEYCARNAQGNWIAFMTSDDLARPSFVRVFMEAIRRYPDAALIRAADALMDDKGRHISNRSLLSVPPYTVAPQTLLQQLAGPKAFFEAAAINRKAFQLCGGFNTELTLFGDWGLWISLSDIGAFATVSSIVSNYRIWDRADRGESRIPAEMRDEIIIYRDMIGPRAKVAGFARMAKRSAANRGVAMLDRIYMAWDSEQLQTHHLLLTEFVGYMGITDLGQALLSGRYRPSRLRALYSNSRTVARRSVEKIVGWH